MNHSRLLLCIAICSIILLAGCSQNNNPGSQSAKYIYYSDDLGDNEIYRIAIDNTTDKTTYFENNTMKFKGSIIFDKSNGYMYIYEYLGGSIDEGNLFRSDMAGNNKESITTQYNIYDFDIDDSNNIYWLNYTDEQIRTCSLDSTSDITDVVNATGFWIENDISENKIYFGDTGSTASTILFDGSDETEISELNGMVLHDVCLDLRNKKLYYYLVFDGPTGEVSSKIKCLDISNGNITTIYDYQSIEYLAKLQVDSNANKLYWIDSKGIFRCNTNGTGVEQLVSGNFQPGCFALY